MSFASFVKGRVLRAIYQGGTPEQKKYIESLHKKPTSKVTWFVGIGAVALAAALFFKGN